MIRASGFKGSATVMQRWAKAIRRAAKEVAWTSRNENGLAGHMGRHWCE